VTTVDEERGLDVVPAGPLAPNPAELLRSDTTESALTKLSDAYDVVIVDSPPVLPVADALVLSRHVDLAVLVAAADNTSRRKLARAVEALRQVQAPIEGIVLNGVGAAEGTEYGYYGEDDEPERKRRGGRRARRRNRG
jgi:capsular exopolysaccharide synthesis family protein